MSTVNWVTTIALALAHGLIRRFMIIIMLNRKLYILTSYIILGPLASWATGGRTACPSPRAAPVDLLIESSFL